MKTFSGYYHLTPAPLSIHGWRGAGGEVEVITSVYKEMLKSHSLQTMGFMPPFAYRKNLRLILQQAWINFLRPGVDTAGQVSDVLKTLLLEQQQRPFGTRAVAAKDDRFLLIVQI